MSKRFEAVIFDLDGTLADTFGMIVAAFNAAVGPFTGQAYSPDEVIARFGDPEPAMIRADLPNDWQAASDAYYRFYREHHHMVRPFEGVPEMLAELKRRGMPMGVVTGKSRRSAEITLEELGWKDLFAAVVTGDEMTKQKPDPQGVIMAARKLGANQNACVMVGDSPADIGAGKAAGMTAIVAAWHAVYLAKLKTVGADHWAQTPADVIRIVS
jgi:pyrophosphatase PpaX